MEPLEDIEAVGGEYARLIVFVEAAHHSAHKLGESEMAKELSMMLTACGTRLDQLTSVRGWDMMDPGE